MIQSSVEYLNAFRRVMSCDYTSVCDIVPSDYEAMYAYKCGLYEQCFRLNQDSVDVLLYNGSRRFTFSWVVEQSELLMLMDDDCLSLIGLWRLCSVIDKNTFNIEGVSQLTLSMYLLVQSKLRLRHLMTSLIDILRLIQRVRDSYTKHAIINCAMMMFVYRKIVLRLKSHQRCRSLP